MCTETWLHPNIKNNEYLPLNYEMYCRDHPGDPHWRVSLAIKEDLHSRNDAWPADFRTDNPDTEMVSAKITKKKTRSVLIGCFYRPLSSSTEYLTSMCECLKSPMVKHPTSTAWLGGDFNLTDIKLAKPPN